MRDYKKLSVFPSFGVSKVKRQVADIRKHLSAEVTVDSSSLKNDDNDDEIPALQLRGYQTEGVNCLLWNWCNGRSCILADDMGLG